MPRDLLDALYFIDELAVPSGLEALEAAAKAKGIRLTHYLDVTPAEVALQLWLRDRKLLAFDTEFRAKVVAGVQAGPSQLVP